jgi:hypothetical protein
MNIDPNRVGTFLSVSQIPKKEKRDFFEVQQLYTEEDDSKQYPEFKKLYKTLKGIVSS